MNADPCLAVLGGNEIARTGLSKVLEDEGFGIVITAAGADALIGMVPGPNVDVVLLQTASYDDALRDCDRIRHALPHVRIVVMVDDFTLEDVARAFQSAAVDGYLVREIACKPLAGALRLVALGEKVFPSQLIETLGSPAPAGDPFDRRPALGAQLSGREQEILHCLVAGESNKIISRRLSISDATVKVHIKAILRKLKVVNRTQAAIWAVSQGLGEDRRPAPMHDLPIGATQMRMPVHQAAAARY